MQFLCTDEKSYEHWNNGQFPSEKKLDLGKNNYISAAGKRILKFVKLQDLVAKWCKIIKILANFEMLHLPSYFTKFHHKTLQYY